MQRRQSGQRELNVSEPENADADGRRPTLTIYLAYVERLDMNRPLRAAPFEVTGDSELMDISSPCPSTKMVSSADRQPNVAAF
jgi:hypothetical protein